MTEIMDLVEINYFISMVEKMNNLISYVQKMNFCSGRIIAGIFLLFTSDKTYRDNISEKYQSNFSLLCVCQKY